MMNQEQVKAERECKAALILTLLSSAETQVEELEDFVSRENGEARETTDPAPEKPSDGGSGGNPPIFQVINSLPGRLGSISKRIEVVRKVLREALI